MIKKKKRLRPQLSVIVFFIVSCATSTVATLAGNRDSVWGQRAGSRIIRLPRLLGEGPMGKPVAHPQDLLYLCTNAKLYGVGGWAKINIGGIIGGNDSMRYSEGR